MSTWAKSYSRTVDQRGENLPPIWCPRPPTGTAAPVSAGGVFRTDPKGALAAAIVTAVDGAGEVVVVGSFLLADQRIERALESAARRGVRVYLALATETRLDKEIRDDSEFDQRALAEHKAMLNRLAGWALIRSAPDFHAKVVLVDPERGGPGFLLTANLTKEALTRNEELGVSLTPEEVREAFAHLAWAVWEAAEHELVEPGRLSSVKGPLGVVRKPAKGGAVLATLRERGTIASAALELVRSAKRDLLVASFGWDADHELVQEIAARAKAGVRVTVLARVRPAAMPALLALAASGARVLGYPHLHAKAIVADAVAGVVMSANLQRHGIEQGVELGVRLEDARLRSALAVLSAWVDQAPFELLTSAMVGGVLGEAQVWTNKQLIPWTISEKTTVDLTAVIAESADRLEAEAAAPPRRFGLPPPAHEVTIQWDVVAPRLAPKSKEVDAKLGKAARSGDPAVFREPGGRLVIGVVSGDEVARAREIAKHVGAAAIVVREKTR